MITRYGQADIQTQVEITKMTLWNDELYDLTNHCLPVRAWRRQPSQQLDKVPERRRPDHLLNTPKTPPNLQSRPIIYAWSYFTKKCNRSLWNPTNNQSIDGPRLARRPLTSLGMSAWPYRVTTKFSYYTSEALKDNCCLDPGQQNTIKVLVEIT